jgi:hypothetical protein
MDKILDAHQDWAETLLGDEGYAPHFAAFLFDQLPGSTGAALRAMRAEVERFHGDLRRGIVGAGGEPPLLVALPAWGVPWRVRKNPADGERNRGLHVRALLLAHEGQGALLAQRVEGLARRRRADRGKLRRVDLEPVVGPAHRARAAELLLEGPRRYSWLVDWLLILPGAEAGWTAPPRSPGRRRPRS